MATAQEVYNSLFEGKKLTLQFTSHREFETLRTALCRINSLQVSLELSTDSVVARWNPEKQQGIFVLGESKNKKSANKWTIVAEEEQSGEEQSGQGISA